MFNCSNMSEACIAGARDQPQTIQKLMWDDIQQLKKDVQKLADDINYIKQFLKKAYP